MFLKFWAKEKDAICEQAHNTFLQKFTGMSVVQPVVCLSTDWRNDVKHNEKKKAKTSEEKQEAEFVEKVYRRDIHVAAVALASKTHMVWCGFT